METEYCRPCLIIRVSHTLSFELMFPYLIARDSGSEFAGPAAFGAL